MLPLDDPRWRDLRHAYGNAGDVPEMLRLLTSTVKSRSADSEVWIQLWSCLCHQGDTYTGSFAAVPHIIQIGSDADGQTGYQFFALPTAIEISRSNRRGPEVPTFLYQAYFASVQDLRNLVRRQLDKSWDMEKTLAVAAALSLVQGYVDVAEAILQLDPDLISLINSGQIDQ